MYKIIVADDHKIVTEGIVRLIHELKVDGAPAGEVVATAYTLEETRIYCQHYQPDILLVDMAMPDGNGIDFIPALQQLCPNMKIAVITFYSEASIIRLALENGARGFFLKAGNPQELVDGLKRVGDGEIFVCEEASRSLQQKSMVSNLTVREREILRLLVEGNTTKEVADKLFLSFETVHGYTKTLRQKLGVNNMASLVREAILQRLV